MSEMGEGRHDSGKLVSQFHGYASQDAALNKWMVLMAAKPRLKTPAFQAQLSEYSIRPTTHQNPGKIPRTGRPREGVQ